VSRRFLILGLVIVIGWGFGPGFVSAQDEDPGLGGPDGSGGPPDAGDLGAVDAAEELGGRWRAKFRNDDCGLTFECRDDGAQPQGNFFGGCSIRQRNILADVASDVCHMERTGQLG